jgi:hypothetical protein
MGAAGNDDWEGGIGQTTKGLAHGCEHGASRLVAAALSGDNRKEITGIDGTPQSITDRSIPKTVFQILGPRQPVLAT